jgi:TolB-like protein
MSLWNELKRRNVVRVGAAYLVVSWLLIEVSDTIFPRLGLPDWTVTLVIALAILAFPLALFLSWAFELTPEGVKRTEDVEPTSSVTPHTGRRLDRFIVVVLLFVIGGLLVERIWFAGSSDEVMQEASPASASTTPAELPASPDSPGPAASPVAAQASASGIAVLPFLNMSPDPENEFFADGISEELLNILARVEGLKVASRTSAFSFKGKNVPVAEIAELLDVQHVLEGSVRKQGTRVRITAQLIDAENDAHLWSQTYERELLDIFRVQEEIAVAITTALEDILGTRQVAVSAPTADLEAYQYFLRGRSRFYQRGTDMDLAIADLQAAVDRDPNFAEAWGFLAASTGVVAGGGYPTELDPAILSKRSSEALARALALDPEMPIALAGMGRTLFEQGQVADGLARLERAARQVSPDTSPKLWLGLSLAETGRVDRALPWFESALAQDPLVSINQGYVGYAYAVTGLGEEALQKVMRGLELNPEGTYWARLLAIEALNRGDIEQFKELRAAAGAAPENTEEFLQAVEAAVGDTDARDDWFARIPTEGAGPNTFRVVLSLLLRDTDRLFEAVERTDRSGENFVRLGAWLPSLGWLREDPRFYAFMRDSGAEAYWEAEGYPGGCRPVDDQGGRRLDCSEYAP